MSYFSLNSKQSLTLVGVETVSYLSVFWKSSFRGLTRGSKRPRRLEMSFKFEASLVLHVLVLIPSVFYF